MGNIYKQVIIRMVFFVATAIAFAFAVAKPQNIFTLLFLVLLIAIQCAGMAKFMLKSQNLLQYYITVIKNAGSTTQFSGKSFQKIAPQLKQELNELTDLVSSIRLDKEKQFQLFEMAFNHISVGVFIINQQTQKIVHVNTACKEILHQYSFFTLSDLEKVNKGFSSFVISQENIQQVYTLPSQNNILVKRNKFALENMPHLLVSIENITSELESKEMESYEKLIRVLTHEIVNSLSPLISLTKSLGKHFTGEFHTKDEELKQMIIDDAHEGLEIIKRRGEGLVEFIQSYRQLTVMPGLKKTSFQGNDLAARVITLISSESYARDIDIQLQVLPANLILHADEKLMEQVIINLLKNSCESFSTKERAKIMITMHANQRNMSVITVEDNGKGITKEEMQQIFVPFFTTKGKGKGIGLSFVKQIIKNHNGTISCQSIPNDKTIFQIELPS